jgi:hypothetical protein
VIAGRLTAGERAAGYRSLKRIQAGFGRVVRDEFPGATATAAFVRQLLHHGHAALGDRPEREAVRARLRRQVP